MDRTRVIEIWVGVFIAAGIAALVMLAFKVSNLGSYANEESVYHVQARFDNVGGLKARSAVSVGGVRVGRVETIEFDNQTFQAVVTLAIATRYNQFPVDTSAQIFTAGLLGEQYVALEPGGDIDVLKDGDELMLTQSALVLEQIIGQFLYSKAEE